MSTYSPSLAAVLAAVCASVLFAQVANAQTVIVSSAMGRLAEADANGDGRVTRAEFLAARAAQFDRFDRNRDGVLTLVDSPPQFIAQFVGVDLPAMLQMFDANKDGQVTRAEFVGGPTPTFNAADTDKNSILDAAELRAAAANARRAR